MRAQDKLRVAIFGGGHAGRGLAGYLSLQGIDVSLYNRTLENVDRIKDSDGLYIHGIVNGFASIPLVTDNIAKAISDRQILIISVPAQAHTYFAHEMAPYLERGQLVLLMPGRTGGALEFANIVRQICDLDSILLGEAQTFSFVSRITGPDSVLISKIKNSVQVSAFPAIDNHRYMNHLGKLPIPLVSTANVLETSLNNVGAMLHPTPTILCAGLLESRCGGYNHYHEGISDSVGKLIEKIDAERVSVAKKFSLNAISLTDWLRNSYDAKGQSLCDCIRSVDAYDGVGSPSTIYHRYVLEDIPTGLVPISHLASLCGLKTPAIDSVINIACHLYERDFWSDGRSLSGMGLEGMIPSEVVEFVEMGRLSYVYPSMEDYGDFYHVEVDDT
ncbi:MAG: NAD/NADP octopine/nopaline dehydrogenase family protein [Candidatus Thorarchaeota archaeon]